MLAVLGAWRSLVAHLNGVQEVPRSNRGAPTTDVRTSPRKLASRTEANDAFRAGAPTRRRCTVDVGPIVATALALILLWLALLGVFWVLRPRWVPVRELVRLIPDLLRLMRSVIVDRSAPLDVRIVLIGLLAWILSPIDLIPEFIPGLGPLDDVVVAVVAFRFALLLRVVGSG